MERINAAVRVVVEPVTLEGRAVRLEPLRHEHREDLELAAADGNLWELRFTSVPAPGGTVGYIEDALAGQSAGTMLPWAVRDLSTGRIAGSTRFHDIVPSIGRVEIGYTWYGRSWQRTHLNTTCKLILLEHAFETLGCCVVGFRTDILNGVSQRAIEALGARKDGTLRLHQMRTDGTVRDSVIYSILRSEWPGVRDRLERRLERHGSVAGGPERGAQAGIEIVLSTPGDVADIVALMTRQLQEHELPADPSGIEAAVVDVLRDPGAGFFLSARRGGEMIGAAFVAFIQSAEHGGRSAWLEEVYLVPERRGLGIGTLLLREAVRRAREAGCRAIDLEVTDDHRRAEHLYEREGFLRLERSRWVKRL